MVLLAGLGVSPMTAWADAWALNPAEDFQQLAKQAKQDKQPIAIYFNRVRCGACEKLKDAAILPMIENGLLDGYVHMVEIRVDAKDETIRDFYGEPVENAFSKNSIMSPPFRPLSLLMPTAVKSANAWSIPVLTIMCLIT